MTREDIKPHTLAYLENPGDFRQETEKIVSLMFPQFDFSLIRQAFKDIERLFAGTYSGYRQCNTRYHDLNHTLHCFLLMTRLIHGAFINGMSFTQKHVVLGLISALMHDTGYIQLAGDSTGTGGKYTAVHIDRSIEFMEGYFSRNGFSLEDYIFCRACLKCTGINVNVKEIQFESDEHETLGKILGTADLMGQMADRDYLRKLPFLYQEFVEAGLEMFENEVDLLNATSDFWEFIQQRFSTEYGNVVRFLRDHFIVRWGIDRDLDREAIERNIRSLKFILKYHLDDYHKYLNHEAIKEIAGEISRIERTEEIRESPVP